MEKLNNEIKSLKFEIFGLENIIRHKDLEINELEDRIDELEDRIDELLREHDLIAYIVNHDTL